MYKFKVGDRVRRTQEFLAGNSSLCITEYIVSSVDGPWISLEGEIYRDHQPNHPNWVEYLKPIMNTHLTPQEVIQCIKGDVNLDFWDVPSVDLEGGVIRSDKVGHPYWAAYFELVSDDYLTPQEVIQCTEEGVELEFLLRGEWKTSSPKELLVSSLFINKYRKKTTNKFIYINGIQVIKPLSTSQMHLYTKVYSIKNFVSVQPHTIEWALSYQVPVWSTREDAESALKAFKAVLE